MVCKGKNLKIFNKNIINILTGFICSVTLNNQTGSNDRNMIWSKLYLQLIKKTFKYPHQVLKTTSWKAKPGDERTDWRQGVVRLFRYSNIIILIYNFDQLIFNQLLFDSCFLINCFLINYFYINWFLIHWHW